MKVIRNSASPDGTDLVAFDGTTLFDNAQLSDNFQFAAWAQANVNYTASSTGHESPSDVNGGLSAGDVTQVSTANNLALGENVTVNDGAAVEIDGFKPQSITFEGATGTLKIDHSVAFTGEISGLVKADALDLSDLSFGANTTATFLGNTTSGILTVTDGINTANIELQGDYLSSGWTLTSDGAGGTNVVDPVPANNWQTLKVGAGGWLTGIDIAPDDTMVVRTDTYGAYIWNGTQWQQLVTSTSMPAVPNAKLCSRRL